MKTPLQFAFQGGGARLALLLPVVHAILDRQDIRITRVAGTSAGGIAAVLLARSANMLGLVAYLREMAQQRPHELRSIFPSALAIGRVRRAILAGNLFFRNRSVVDERKFADFIANCLRKAGISPDDKIGGKPPCILVSTDIIKKKVVPCNEDDRILQLLIDTAALPFIFRTTGGCYDGGIVDNLPVDHLGRAGGEDGEILAIGFKEDAYNSPKKGVVSLALSLMDSAMTSKTRSTVRQLGDNFVLALSPNVGDGIVVDSFDVEGFIAFMGSELAYETRYQQANKWIEGHIQRIRERDTKTIVLTPTPADEPTGLYANIVKIADGYHQLPNLEFVVSSMDVIAHSLGDANNADLVRVRDTIRVVEGQANIYVTHLFSSNAASAINARFFVADKLDRPVEFSVLEVPIRGRSSKSCVIVFIQPLIAGTDRDTVTIIQEQEIASVMDVLHRDGADYLSVGVSQGIRASRVEIGLAIPKKYGDLLLEDGTPDRMATLQLDPLAASELTITPKSGERIPRAIQGAPEDFATFGWKAADLKRGEIARVIYRLKNGKRSGG